MKMTCITVLVSWLLLAVAVVTERTIRFSDNCPTDHYITKPDGSVLRVELYHSDKKCSNFLDSSEQQSCEDCKKVERMKKKSPRRGFEASKDLDRPNMTPVIQDNIPMARIEIALPAISDGKYPRNIYLEMVAYNRSNLDGRFNLDTVDTNCIYLNITNSTGDSYWDPLKFSFTCTELVQDSTDYILFTMQMWSLPNRGSRSQLCRSTRAIGGQRSCGVRCSEESMFPLTIAGENEFHLCACADKGRVNTTARFKGDNHPVVKIEGLPPFIGDVTVVLKKESGYAHIFEKVLESSSIEDGRTEFEVTTPLMPGNYTLLIDAECQFTRRAHYREIDDRKKGINRLCGNEDDIHALKQITIRAQTVKEFPKIILVLGLLAFVTLITCSVFIFWQIRRRTSRSKPNSIQESNNQRELIPLETYSTHTVNSSSNQELENETLLPPDKETAIGHTTTSEASTERYLDHGRNGKTMITYHPDNQGHADLVQRFITVCSERGINMKSGDPANWRDFAEAATDDYTNIVIVLSEKMNQLLMCYKDGVDSELFRQLAKERHMEYIPCVVLDKIRMRVQEKSRTFTLHVVTLCNSTDEGNKLTEDFLKGHDFLKRTNSCIIYNFTDTFSGDDQFDTLIEIILSQ